MAKIVWELPLKTVPESNRSEHWSVSSKRHRQQQFFIRMLFNGLSALPHTPCKITLTRLSSKCLDSDENLPMAFKWIKDEISECIFPEKRGHYIRRGKTKTTICPLKGRADDDKKLTWCFQQEKNSRQGIRIEIEELELSP